ncbi:MAG TPA: methyltransferase [Bryobacteraceae bacterium]|nr:methyltransferase [Bryobacteraceae bacterium]
MPSEILPSAPPPQAVLLDTVFHFFRAKVTQVFAELQVADALAAGRDPGVNRRFLAACAAIGLIQVKPDAGYALTPLGEALRTDVPGSLRGFVASVMGGGHYTAWGNLALSARTEACAFDATFGENVWAYFTRTNPAEGHLFNQAMASSSAVVVQSLLAHYDFPQTGTLVDVAGGNGSMAAAILESRPGLRGVVMDLAFTQEEANENLAARGVADRCRFVPGDFFQEVPAGGDIYTMKWILHDWADDKAGAILRTVHRAMPAHAKLVLAEAVIPEEGDALYGRMMDINMMVMCGGKERTAREWTALLDANGFGITRIVEIPGPVSIVEAAKK